MEYCEGGTLINLLEKYNGVLNLEQILYIMKNICNGLKALHDLGIMHLDLKVENVLMNKAFKLCDFGSCYEGYIDISNLSRQ